MNDQIGQIAERFAQISTVQAVALAGSQANQQAGGASDFDVYIYSEGDLPADERRAVALEFSADAQVSDYWGAGAEWDGPAGTHIDAVFFTTGWMTDQIDRVLTRCEPGLGYTTCFWHTIRISRPLFDRNSWLADLQARAQSPYPDLLARRIVAHNFPVLRDVPSSYRAQLMKAAQRSDLVSLNHRAAALLASVFDIVFAINHQTHPGEKRLLDLVEQTCPLRPAGLRDQITVLLRATSADTHTIGAAVDRLIDPLESLLEEEGWL